MNNTAAAVAMAARRRRLSYAGFIKFYLFKYRTRRVEVITIQFVNLEQLRISSINQQLNQLKILVNEVT